MNRVYGLLGTATAVACDEPSILNWLDEFLTPAFEVLEDIWSQLQVLKSACPQDRFLTGLTVYLENQLAAAGLVLTIQAELLSRR